MKDHEKRELVDKLTAIAREYASTQQLRARIADVILPTLPREDPHAEHWKALAKAAEAISASPNCGPEQATEFCRAIDRLSAAIMGEYDPPVGLPELTDDMLRYAMACIGTGSPAEAERFRLFWRFADEAYKTRKEQL